MPSPWTSHLPQWNTPAQPTYQHPPQPASSTYSPARTARSDALRPLSGFFARLTTPRLGQQPSDTHDVAPVPVIPWPAQHQQQHVFEVGPGQRSQPSRAGSPIDPPQPLFAQQTTRPALAPPAPIYPGAANAAGDLPVSFSPSEIGAPQPAPAQPRRHRRHRRHNRPTHRRATANNTSSSSINYRPKPALRDPAIRIKLMHTVIAGALLVTTVIVFLALMPQTDVFSPPFRIVNSLLIIFLAVIFLHCAITLNSMILAFRRKQKRLARKNREADGIASGSRGMTSIDAGGPGRSGRVQYFDDPEIGLPPPGEPIRVVLARDEEIGVNDDLNVVAEDEHVATHNNAAEAARHESQDPDLSGHEGGVAPSPASESPALRVARPQTTPKPPPPVYGVWRGSVRADPNLLHWQRAERQNVGSSRSADEEEAGHSRPPPSYVTQEMRTGGAEYTMEGLETLPATRYVI